VRENAQPAVFHSLGVCEFNGVPNNWSIATCHGKRIACSPSRSSGMNARRISAAILLTTTVMWCTPKHLHGQSADSRADSSFSSVEVVRQHRYAVDARVRPLLFWIRKQNMGDGRLTWRRGPNGAIGYELLVGSDPARAPRQINRWGYLREESAGNGALMFGIMSHSDEQSVEEADKNTSGTDTAHTFKALRQFLTESQARVTLSEIRVQKDLTYSDLDTLLSVVPAAPSKTKTVSIAQWTSPGFLTAAASLMEEGRTAVGGATRAQQHLTRIYPYDGGLYELQMRSLDRIDRYTREGRSFGPAIRGLFRVLNRTTGEETPFTVVYGVEGDLTGVPLLISWRPRWWLEIECVIRHD
jgi:hypothetical protein